MKNEQGPETATLELLNIIQNSPNFAISDETGFIPYGRQNVNEADITRVCEVLRSDFLTQGPAVPAFEKAVAKKVIMDFWPGKKNLIIIKL
mgnify:CR=1 FL=1